MGKLDSGNDQESQSIESNDGPLPEGLPQPSPIEPTKDSKLSNSNIESVGSTNTDAELLPSNERELGDQDDDTTCDEKHLDVLDETKKEYDTQSNRKLTLMTLMAITYFLVAGGPYGLENMVSTVPNPFYVVLFFILFPMIYALPLSMVCAELATAIPESGGVMSWTSKAFGHFIGFEVGFCLSMTYLLDISLYPVMFISYLQALGYDFGFWLNWALGCAIVCVLTIVNIIGIEIVGFVSILFIVIVTSPFIAIPIMGVRYLDPLILVRGIFDFPINADWGFFLTLLIWNNSGWISPGFLASETKNPQKTYPLAMVITMVFANLTYVIPLAVGMCINREWDKWTLGFFAKIGRDVGGNWLMVWIMIASMCTSAGLFNAAMSTSSRSISSMAEKGYFPKFLGCKTPVTGTPFVAIMIDFIVTVILTALPFSTLIGAQTTINSMTMCLLFISFIYLRFKKKDMARPFRIPVNNFFAVVICIFPIIISFFNIIQSETSSKIAALLAILIATFLYPLRFWKDCKAFFLRCKDRISKSIAKRNEKNHRGDDIDVLVQADQLFEQNLQLEDTETREDPFGKAIAANDTE